MDLRRASGDLRKDPAPRAIAICVKRDPTLSVLLVRTRSGRWTFPGGKVERGETPAAAAGREALEEAGVEGRVQTVSEAGLSERRPGRGRVLTPAFILEVDRIVPASEEFRSPRWCSPRQAARLVAARRWPWDALRRRRLLRRVLRGQA